jgi:PmbA protein
MESKIDFLFGLEDLALNYDPLIKQSNGAWSVETISTTKLVNSHGLELSFDDTFYRVGVDVIAAKGDEMYPGEGSFSVRHFDDLPKPEEMVDRVAGKAVRLLGGTSIDPGDYEIILTGRATGSLLWGLSFALNGDDFIKGSSFLSGKEGDKFADSKFSLFDDATMPRGVSSRPFDDEGVASEKIALVEKGVLKSALYDLKTAAKAGKTSTGSSAREEYNIFPGIGTSNFYIGTGTDKFDDVLASCKKGILVEDTQGWGLHSITGQYSAGINGTLIRNGKRIKPVANITLAGGTDDIFNGVGAVCDDISFYHRFNSPTLMIKKMHVGA